MNNYKIFFDYNDYNVVNDIIIKSMSPRICRIWPAWSEGNKVRMTIEFSASLEEILFLKLAVNNFTYQQYEEI